MEAEIRQHEEALRKAMLASDVAALDSLIADGLIFVGPTGEVFRKQDDLALHRSGRQSLTVAEWRSVDVEMRDRAAVALVTADLAGSIDGNAFHGRFRYCASGPGRAVVGRCSAARSSRCRRRRTAAASRLAGHAINHTRISDTSLSTSSGLAT